MLKISSGVGNGYTCGEMTGLTDILKSPQILIPPSFLFIRTMGVAHSLCSIYLQRLGHSMKLPPSLSEQMGSVDGGGILA